MKPRFRVRTVDGRELEPQTIDVLAELIRSGSVRPDDLLFDGDTGEWAPARTHTVAQALWSTGPGSSEGEESPGPSTEESDEADLDLELVAPRDPSPDQKAETFIARMEKERQRDAGPEAPLIPDAPSLLGDSGMVEGLQAPAPPTPPPPSFSAPDGSSEPMRITAPAEARAAGPPGWGKEAPSPPVGHASTRRRKARRRLAWLGNGWILAVVLPLIAVAGSATLARTTQPTSPIAQLPNADGGTQAASPRAVPITEVQVREVAYQGFLTALTNLRTDFDVWEVPADWLEGWYLASPSSYPEVRRFWERFLDYAEEAYASEVLLYREAYLEAATDAGMSGPVRSLRMAAAVEAFEIGRGRRESHYSRVWNLAISSMALHDQLLQMEGRITYEPARGQRLSADPVLEAAGQDDEAQGRLEVALDRVLRDLHVPDVAGVKDRSLVASWLVDGLREASGGG